MLIRARLRSLALCLLVLPVAAGCASENRIANGLSTFPWVTTSDVPDSRNELRNPSQLDLSYAQWQEHLGNLPEAEQSYKRVLESNPKSLNAKLGLARLAQLGGHTEVAEAAYLDAVEMAPESALALDALGQFYAAGHRWTDAVKTLSRATELAPDDKTTRHHYAVALARSGDVTASLAQFSQAVGEAEGYYNLGYILHEQGQITAAEQAFLKAISLRSDLTAAQQMLAEIRQQRGPRPELADAAAQPQAAEVTPTAAVANANWSQHVTPASGSVAQTAARQMQELPESSPSVNAITQPVVPDAPAAAAEQAISQDLPRWEMPTRHEPALLSAEQVESRSSTP